MDTYTMRVLVIDSDQAVRKHLYTVLRSYKYRVYEAENAQAGLQLRSQIHFDLILTDPMLPDIDAMAFIKQLNLLDYVPILIICSNDDNARKVAMLEAGADDYIVKPYNVNELLARIKVALRRTRRINNAEIFTSGEMKIDFIHRMVTIGGFMVDLTPTEYEILRLLVLHADRSVSHQEIWQAIGVKEEFNDAHGVRVHISNLRRKLNGRSGKPNLIATEVGRGYRFQTNSN